MEISEEIIFALLMSYAVVIAVVCHFLTKNYLFASTAASVFVPLSVQIGDYVIRGYMDPFAIFAFPAAVLYCFFLALVVGIPFAIIRKWRGERILFPIYRTKQGEDLLPKTARRKKSKRKDGKR